MDDNGQSTSAKNPYVIADGGACHDGDCRKMIALVEAAAEAGCDAYKTQWTSRPVAMARRRGAAEADGYAAIYRRYLAWPEGWHSGLHDACRRVGIDYICTVFLPEDVEAIAPYVAKFKVASFEAEDFSLLGAIRPVRDGRDVLISCGMQDWSDFLPEMYRAAVYSMFGTTGSDVIWMHCVSAYPAPMSAQHLRLFNQPVGLSGYSDHTDPVETWTGAVALAVSRRVRFIEAHLRLDETDPANPDFPHAMTPAQFAQYVRTIRLAAVALGDGPKRIEECEAAMLRYKVGAPINRLIEDPTGGR